MVRFFDLVTFFIGKGYTNILTTKLKIKLRNFTLRYQTSKVGINELKEIFRYVIELITF